MKRQFVASLVLVLSVLASCSVSAFQSYQMVGEGSMRWFVFQLYQAKLLSPDGNYKIDKWPIALELTYLREIAKTDLIEATKVEWQRMEVEYSPLWLDELTNFWPDVAEGDVLVFHVDESAIGRFYYNENFIGSVEDDAFSAAFLRIWLSEKSRNQALKDKLVGE